MTESFAQLFEESLASQKIKPGSILTGRIVEVGEDFVIVNAGLKSEAVIPADQFKNDRGEIEVNVGDDVVKQRGRTERLAPTGPSRTVCRDRRGAGRPHTG